MRAPTTINPALYIYYSNLFNGFSFYFEKRLAIIYAPSLNTAEHPTLLYWTRGVVQYFCCRTDSGSWGAGRAGRERVEQGGWSLRDCRRERIDGSTREAGSWWLSIGGGGDRWRRGNPVVDVPPFAARALWWAAQCLRSVGSDSVSCRSLLLLDLTSPTWGRQDHSCPTDQTCRRTLSSDTAILRRPPR